MARSYPVPGDDVSRFAAIVLAVSDFLERRPKDATTLSLKEQQIVKEGLYYLDLAKVGQETVQLSGASIVASDDSLSVYQETSQALRWAHSTTADPNGKRNLFSTSVRVLGALLEGKALNELDPEAVERTRSFFRTLEDYCFKGQFSHTGDSFDHPYGSLEE